MQKHIVLFFAFFIGFGIAAAEAPLLPEPSRDGKTTLDEALQMRCTVRDFDAISENEMPQLAADLLWSACGINRKDGKKVVPAALARYAVSVYFADRRAVYRFDAKANKLDFVSDGDALVFCASNRAMCEKASAALLFVIDDGVWGKERSEYAALEAGAMMQNVYLACAARKLGTVACGSFDGKNLQKLLALKSGERVFLTMPFGRLPATR